MPTDTIRIDPALLAALLTSAGAPVAASIVSGVVEFLKSLLPAQVTGHERLLSFILAGVVLGIAYAVGLTVTPPYTELSLVGLLALPLAWYNVGRLAMAIHDDATRKPGSLREPSAAEVAATDPVPTAIPTTNPAPPVPESETADIADLPPFDLPSTPDAPTATGDQP